VIAAAMTQSVATSIIALLDHLQIQHAHIAARMDTDWRDLTHISRTSIDPICGSG